MVKLGMYVSIVRMKYYLGRNIVKFLSMLTLYTILLGVIVNNDFKKAYAAKGVQDIIYVDCSIGIDQANCGLELSPCKSPGYAAQYMDGGQSSNAMDTMYIKGTCHIVGEVIYRDPTIYPRGNYSKFTTWPGEPQAFIDGGKSPTGTVIGTRLDGGRSNITLDNLQINGEISFMYTTDMIISNCDLWGGGTKDISNLGTWCDILFTADCLNGRIVNNKFHDADGSCTTAAQMHTHYGKASGDSAEMLIIENNDYYVTSNKHPMFGVFLKDNPESIYVRKNFFKGLDNGVRTSNQPEIGHNVNISNNVFLNCGNTATEHGAVQLMTDVATVNIYNNTFINSVYADIGSKWNGVPFGAWNNIHYSNAPFIRMSYNSTVNSLVNYLNYNSYYSPSSLPTWTEKNNYNSFVSWKGYVQSLSKNNVTENNSSYGTQNLSNFFGNDALSFNITSATPQSIIYGGRNDDGYSSYIGAWDPIGKMWIGYCSIGIDRCDITGNSSDIAPSIESITITQ